MNDIVIGVYGGRQQALTVFRKAAPADCDVEEGSPDNLQAHNGPFTFTLEEDNQVHTRDDGSRYTIGGWTQWIIKDKSGRTCWKRKNFESGGPA